MMNQKPETIALVEWDHETPESNDTDIRAIEKLIAGIKNGSWMWKPQAGYSDIYTGWKPQDNTADDATWTSLEPSDKGISLRIIQKTDNCETRFDIPVSHDQSYVRGQKPRLFVSEEHPIHPKLRELLAAVEKNVLEGEERERREEEELERKQKRERDQKVREIIDEL